ncbi:MAG: MinD/ParA family protein [Haloarculaceae archaeon]
MGVYAFAGGKGGVGKTTTAVNVGVALSRNGYDVLVVDADLGMTDLARLLEVDAEPGIHGVLAGEAPMSAALVDGPEDVDVLPGATDLDAVERADPAKLPAVLSHLSDHHEFVLVDTSAGLSHEVLVALGAADGVALLTTPKETALGDTARTADLAARVDGTVLGTVVSRATHETDLDAVEQRVGESVVGVVADDPAVTDTGVVAATPGDLDTAAAGYHWVADLLEAVEFADDVDDAVASFTDPDLPPEPDPADSDVDSDSDSESPSDDDATVGDGDGDGDDGSGRSLTSAFDPGILGG